MSKKLKHLLVSVNYPPKVGGISSYLHKIMRSYFKNYRVIAAIPNSPTQKYIANVNFDPPRQPLKFLRLYQATRRLYKKWSFSFIHFGCINSGILLGILFKFIFGTRFTIFTHVMEIIPNKTDFLTKAKLVFFLKQACLVFANSHFTQNILQKTYGISPTKIMLLPPVIDPLPPQPPRPSRRLQKLASQKYIFCICRLVARKGVDTLIQSMASLQKDFPHIKLVIAGDGPQKEELLNLSRRQKIANKCLFIGKVSETEKNWLLHNCYVFAMPNKQVGQSDVEGFGIVFLEAALHGKPVIGGNSGGVPDAISNKRTGFLVEPENDADLANLLRSILKNPDRAKKMGQKGQAWVQKNFVIDKYNPKIEKYLQQL